MTTWVAMRKYTRHPKTQYFPAKKKTENPHNMPERLVRCRSDFEMQCFRNCTLSSFFGLNLHVLHRMEENNN